MQNTDVFYFTLVSWGKPKPASSKNHFTVIIISGDDLCTRIHHETRFARNRQVKSTRGQQQNYCKSRRRSEAEGREVGSRGEAKTFMMYIEVAHCWWLLARRC
jgi:hypothetical protein